MLRVLTEDEPGAELRLGLDEIVHELAGCTPDVGGRARG